PSFLPAPLPSSSPPSGLEVDAGILSFSPSAGEDRVRLTTFGADSAFCDLGDESLPPPSSPSISPASSSSYLSSSPSESEWDADVSSLSPGSPALTGEVGLVTEGIVSAPGALVGESTLSSLSERIVMPITAPSSISTAAIVKAPTPVSSNYFRGPKKAFIARESFMGTFVVPTSSGVASGSSSSEPVDVSNVSLVAAATCAAAGEDDMGVRLSVLMNQGLSPSPSPAAESSVSMIGVRGGVCSSHLGSAQRVSGRKRKRSS
ncbi:hypothetical protein, partial [Candidatus Ichthyocystis sparus]